VATIDLGALTANYRRIQAELNGVQAAAMVKANGYGLGAPEVTKALAAAGCRSFFVAGLDEAMRLRACEPQVEIRVLEGPVPGSAATFIEHGLQPVINSLGQLDRWSKAATNTDRARPIALHVDTGMSRLGLDPDEYERLIGDLSVLDGVAVDLVMSHLASADVTGSQQSPAQLQRFHEVRGRLPMGRASLANSAGIFLGAEYHFDLVRPGIALYGGSPFPDSGQPNPMRSVLRLEAPILQVRNVDVGETVGYGATHRVTEPGRIATLPVGYADGFLRASSSTGFGSIGGQTVPLVGRVSMDLITIDVTEVHESLLYPGAPVELVGEQCPIDEVANRADSIPHEFLTNLSGRFETRYLSP
jgi:alanine racemase